MANFLLPCLLVVNWEHVLFDTFDYLVGDDKGRITSASCLLDCDDDDLAEVDLVPNYTSAFCGTLSKVLFGVFDD